MNGIPPDGALPSPGEEPIRKSVEAVLRRAREASRRLPALDGGVRDAALETLARLLEERRDILLQANARDLAAQQGVLSPSLLQRLKLDAARIAQLARGTRDVAALPDPVGLILSRTLLDDGLVLEKRSVPLGVVAIVFESRPDVIPQILSLVLKSGNAVVFKGGAEAVHSNRAFLDLALELGRRHPELPEGWAQMVEGREAVRVLLAFPEYVDLVVPRGSAALVRWVQESTRIPVLGHAEGICHLYVHESADLDRALAVVLDAKLQYPAACNAVEVLLVDRAVAFRFLPRLAAAAAQAGLTLRGCPEARATVPGMEAATEEDWRTEFGGPVLAVRVVGSLDEAIVHINRHGSHHTDGILAEDQYVGERFLREVDSASVMVNASTRFADGYRYGLGAEVGISTARIHARGPVGLQGLVTYKYCLRGQGHVVADYVGPSPARSFRHQDL